MTNATLIRVPFWYLRHGETDWNARNLAQGRTEVPLNANGLAQAKRAAEQLQGQGIVSIVSSPLSRAYNTAQIVARSLDLPVLVEPELVECAYGEEEGQPMSEWFDSWIEERFTPAGGETFVELRQRAVRAVNRCLAQPGPVLVVAHGALMRALRVQMGLERLSRTRNAVPIHCRPEGNGWHLDSIAI